MIKLISTYLMERMMENCGLKMVFSEIAVKFEEASKSGVRGLESYSAIRLQLESLRKMVKDWELAERVESK